MRVIFRCQEVMEVVTGRVQDLGDNPTDTEMSTNKYGHFADECYNKNGQKRSDDEANIAHDEDSDFDPVVLMVTTNSKPGGAETWYLD